MTAYELLDPQTLALLKAAPENPTARALVLSKTGLNIPPGLKRFETVVRWLRAKQPVPGAVPVNDLQVKVDISEVRSGTCSFKARFYGSGTATITKAKILEIARYGAETDSNLNDVVVDIGYEIGKYISENIEAHVRDEDSTTFSEYDIENSESQETDWDGEALKQQTRAILKALDPELYAKLVGELPLTVPAPEADPEEEQPIVQPGPIGHPEAGPEYFDDVNEPL